MNFRLLLIFALVLFSVAGCKKSDNDTVKPWIVLKGYNPVYSELGKPYEDAGATVWDVNSAGDTVDISDNLRVTDNININVVGKYEVTYNAEDDAGNKADAVSRTVYIQVFK